MSNELLKQRISCGNLNKSNVDSKHIVVSGWVYHFRDQGGVLFVDLRERSGVLQVVFDRSYNEKLIEIADTLRSEDVILVKGILRARSAETVNSKLITGDVELVADELYVLNKAQNLPFSTDDYVGNLSEEKRLQYRYLDFRRTEMAESLFKRHEFTTSIRNFLNNKGFWEVETPILNKSTPEGARDYLVPSRLNPGEFYALPQSPQIFKQILMIGQVERYYQIARCFRDEDLRRDRQPEFTQVDLEMAFITKEQVMSLMEDLVCTVLKSSFNIDLFGKVSHMTYNEAMEKYGSDKPDLRFDMQLIALDDWAKTTEFKVFKQAVDSNGRVMALCVPGGGALSRKDLEDLTEWVGRDFGAKGLAWIKHTENGLESVVTKFLPEQSQQELIKLSKSKVGDIILFGADKAEVVFNTLSGLRLNLAKKFNMIPENSWKATWVTDFPLFYFNESTNTLDSMHNPFTSPYEDDMSLIQESAKIGVKNLDKATLIKLGNIPSKAYDFALNGIEIGGGGIRMHQSELQLSVLKLLGIDEESAYDKFGFLLNALKHGAPPHGGLAFGLDRILMLGLGRESIRDVIPFPKTQKGQCPMSQAPSSVDKKQLDELFIKTSVPVKKD